MAVTQIFSVPSYLYCVIDQAAVQKFPTLSDNAHIGYDTASVVPLFGAASDQGGSVLGSEVNHTIPDFVEDQTKILNNPGSATISYSNPS